MTFNQFCLEKKGPSCSRHSEQPLSASAPHSGIENSMPCSQRGGETLGILNVNVIKGIS